ncbi:MAG: T9SS type A sorting domain-containing protein [Bacteroidota bacterium]
MKRIALCCLTACFALTMAAQNFTSYFTGNQSDLSTQALGGVCLMGGATEDDNAMRWFLERANGGDVLVIRASGSDGYNGYLYSDLGVNVNSVETIVFHNAAAAADPHVLDRISKAEAIWIAGGNQANYVNYWRNNEVANLINEGLLQRNIVIGGTSAGMAILGGSYFSAVNGTVNSFTALSNPYGSSMAVDHTPFIRVPYLQNVITDTHYNNPDRRGRHLTFLARAMTDTGENFRGIACDEYTAVCIDESGLARIFGTYPDFDDNAYFLIPNCGLADSSPEVCASGEELTWDHNGEAVKVYAVKGTPSGLYSIDLNDWLTSEGGSWQNWSAQSGSFSATNGTEPDCLTSSTVDIKGGAEFRIYPNPNDGGLVYIETINPLADAEVRVLDMHGRQLQSWTSLGPNSQLNVSRLAAGTYFLEYRSDNQRSARRLLVR